MSAWKIRKRKCNTYDHHMILPSTWSSWMGQVVHGDDNRRFIHDSLNAHHWPEIVKCKSQNA
eukprot:4821931-Pleurochrysis_carterae.AAC.4